MASIKLYLDKRRALRDGTYPLRVSIIHNGKTILISTGLSVAEDQWDDRHTQVRKRRNADQMNIELLEILADYSRALAQVMSQRGASRLPADKVKAIVHPEENTAPLFVERFITRAKKFGKNSCGVRMRTLNTLRSFCPDIDKLTFDDMDKAWLRSFTEWMRNERKLSDKTMLNYIAYIRAVFIDALDEEVITYYPFRGLRLGLKNPVTKKRNLPREELARLLTEDVGGKGQRFLDLFRLSFYCIGMNTADLSVLRMADIYDGRIEYDRRKTRRHYSVLLQPEARAIINKYNDGAFAMGALCGLSIRCLAGKATEVLSGILGRRVTMYYARHSWTTIAASLDIPKDTIAQALGHSQNTVTDVYIEFNRGKVDAANRRVIDYVLGKED